MDAPLLVSLIGLALLDSLNPFTVAAQAYLLGTRDPMPRSIAFLLGTFAAYFLGGVLLLEGLSLFLECLWPVMPRWAVGAGEMTLGLAAAVLAITMSRQASRGEAFTLPSNLGVLATLLFAVASTLSDMATALPYFGAATQIAAAELGFVGRWLLLALYNLIYCAPLIGLIVARAVMSSERSDVLFGRLRRFIDWAFAKLLPSALALIAITFLIDGGRRIYRLSS
ncbi:hypothetical protein OCOJLMKI_0803 [Methylobacterium iners]|uniref:Uncharacterized protein n=2 Tax=Methylobacterium iners TaxID=418707 RepID=A0ABQ4RTR5_9HYPH|nr:hypothetical protein OCOJLMKI_0803 [Methylobacterium iners]